MDQGQTVQQQDEDDQGSVTPDPAGPMPPTLKSDTRQTNWRRANLLKYRDRKSVV